MVNADAISRLHRVQSDVAPTDEEVFGFAVTVVGVTNSRDVCIRCILKIKLNYEIYRDLSNETLTLTTIKDCQERLQWLNGRKAEISRSLEGYRKAKFFVNDMLEKVKSEEYSYGGLMEEMESAYADPEYRMAYSDGQSFQHPDAYRQSQHFPGPPAHPPSTYYNYSSDPVFGVPASVLQSQRYPPPPSVGHP
jgi:hypothetical protein